MKSTYSTKKKDSKKTGGGPVCRYTILESFYKQIFGWQANITGIQGDGLHEVVTRYTDMCTFCIVSKNMNFNCSLILSTSSCIQTLRTIWYQLTWPLLDSQILTEDPDGHQSKNQQYIKMQDLQEHTVFTQQHGQCFDSNKQNQLFVSTQQTASSNCSTAQIERYFIAKIVIVENVFVNIHTYICMYV